MINHNPKTRSKRGVSLLTLALVMGVALPSTDWGGTPTLFEPGFLIEEYEECTATSDLPSFQPSVEAAACGPGGTGLYVGAHTDTEGLLLLLDPPNRPTILYILGNRDDLSIADMDFAPPGWRGGDLLYFTIKDGLQPNFATGAWGLDAFGNVVDTFMIHSFTESIWELAIDPTGTFGDDIFFWFGTTLYRRDAAGSLTTVPGATGLGALAFGPGGPWTSDLYTRDVIVAPDGSIRPSPVRLEGTWAHGPGFEGDLFTLCDMGQTCRVKPDGTETLFGEDLGVKAVFCDGALWFFDRIATGACRAIRPCGVVDGDLDGFTDCEGDCDDTHADIYPGAAPICDGVNNDCEDPFWPALTGTNEQDGDGDGFSECSGDCDDGDAAIHPGAADLPGDSLDQDCDGAPACDPDAPWPNPGEFVSCVAQECGRLVSEGAVSHQECAVLIRSAAGR